MRWNGEWREFSRCREELNNLRSLHDKNGSSLIFSKITQEITNDPGGTKTNQKTSTNIDETSESQSQRTVRCMNCEHEITNPAFAIEPYEHTFRNPAGFSFHVVCYSDAPGAADVGVPTTLATWFPGYAWSFAICMQCQNHLGWWYSGKDRFAGLIASRLIR